jgi:prepilin-type N-terminal cleavage/methylation domain-containing protein
MRPLRLILCDELANARDGVPADRDNAVAGMAGLPPRRESFAKLGFTLAELAVVLLIMGVFTAVSVPKFLDSLLYHRVESAARRVKTDLELARQTARQKSTSVSVTFTGSTYTLGGGIKGLDNPGAVYTVNLAADPFSLDGVVANFSSTQMVTFDGYGNPTSAGTVALSCKNQTCTVTLNGASGEATISSNHSSNGVSQDDSEPLVGP